MGDEYKPPFTITETITNLIIEIGELVGRITEKENLSMNPKLRRNNRIKTIYSSLAIEQNAMSLEQVSDVIDGRRVLAPPKDIREVKNAYEAYEELQKMNPYSMKDLLKAHRFMMDGLVVEAGTSRSRRICRGAAYSRRNTCAIYTRSDERLVCLAKNIKTTSTD